MSEEIIQYVFLFLAYKSIFFCFIKEKFLEEFFISVFSYMLIKRLLHFYKTPNYIDKKEFLKVFCILPEFRILKISATFYLALCKLIRAFKFCIFKIGITKKLCITKIHTVRKFSIFKNGIILKEYAEKFTPFGNSAYLNVISFSNFVLVKSAPLSKSAYLKDASPLKVLCLKFAASGKSAYLKYASL